MIRHPEKLCARWVLDVWLILVLMPASAVGFAPVETIRVFIDKDLLTDAPISVWDNRAGRILRRAELLLCNECNRARGTAGTNNCRVKFSKAGSVSVIEADLQADMD